MTITQTVAEACRQEFIAGKGSLREIAEAHEVSHRALRARASRGNWHQERTQIVAGMSQRVAERVAEQLPEMAEQFVIKMAGDALETLEHALQIEKPTDLHQLNTREQVLNNLNRRGRATFNLDESGAQTNQVVGINIVAANSGRLLVEAMTAIEVDTGDPEQS